MSVPISLAAIWKMLDRCAEGYSRELKTHHHWVRYRGKTFQALPKGRHGAKRPEAQLHHVVGLISHLEIDEDCARREIPQLPKAKPAPRR
jgi:hypothetical protein